MNLYIQPLLFILPFTRSLSSVVCSEGGTLEKSFLNPNHRFSRKSIVQMPRQVLAEKRADAVFPCGKRINLFVDKVLQ
jgi:hypothetical protein